jgi:hypothetical protein
LSFFRGARQSGILAKKNGIHGKFEENLGKIGILGKNLGKIGILAKNLGKVGRLAKNLGKIVIVAKNLEYLGKIWMDYLLKEKWNT